MRSDWGISTGGFENPVAFDRIGSRDTTQSLQIVRVLPVEKGLQSTEALAEEAFPSDDMLIPGKAQSGAAKAERLALIAIHLGRHGNKDLQMHLQCFESGFYKHGQVIEYKSLCTSGLLYEFPIIENRECKYHYDLRGAFDSKHRMPLEQRFALAHSLGVTLLNLHKLSWLHRRLSVTNLVYFHPDSEPPKTLVAKHFFLLGFADGRADSYASQTEGNETQQMNRHCQHPLYRTRKMNYQI